MRLKGILRTFKSLIFLAVARQLRDDRQLAGSPFLIVRLDYLLETLDPLKARFRLLEVKDQHLAPRLAYGFDQGVGGLLAATVVVGRDV